MFFAKAQGKKGEIFIYEDIGEGWFGGITAKSFADELRKIGNVDSLDVYINSPGGSVFDGLAIYNQLLRHGAEVTTHIDGIAASIASVIALAGKQVKIAANGTFMIHDPWSFAVGTAEDMRRSADVLDKLRDTLLDTYVARTGGKREEISDLMANETWMNADEALKHGFVTEIIESKNVEASFPLVSKFKNAPKELLAGATNSQVLLARMKMKVQKIGRASPSKA